MTESYIKVQLPNEAMAVCDVNYEVTGEPTAENIFPYLLHLSSYPSYSKYVCFGPEPEQMTAEKKWDIVQGVAEEYDQYLYSLYYAIEKNYLANAPEAEAFPDGWKGEIELIPFFDMRDDVWSVYDKETAIYNGNTPSSYPAIIVSADCDVF